MRIRRSIDRAQAGAGFHLYKWARSHTGVVRFLLTVALGVALAIAAGTWYRLAGYRTLNPIFRNWFGRSRAQSNDLPTLRIDLGLAEHQALVGQRERAWRRGILQSVDADWVEAQIHVQDETIPVRMRLDGDSADHWQENKWSLQVQVARDDRTLLGMRTFSLQSPATCGYLNEWLHTESLRRAGILAPRFSFVNVNVSGEKWGVYALKEGISQALFASQARPAGVLVRFDDRTPGHDRAWNAPTFADPIATSFALPAFVSADEFDAIDVSGDPVLQKQGVAVLGLLHGFQTRQLAASEVFNAELVGRYLAHVSLWGTPHELAWYSGRYYYNSSQARLEPIGTHPVSLEPMDVDLVDTAQYDDLRILQSYAQEVLRISQPGYLKDLEGACAHEFERYGATLAQEFFPAYLQAPWEILSGRQATLLAALHPLQTVYAYHHVVDDWGAPGRMQPTLDITVGNLLQYPVALQEIRYGDRAVDVQSDWVVGSDDTLFHREAVPSVVLRRVQETAPRTITVRIPAPAVEELYPQGTPHYSDTLQIVTHLVGVDEPIVVDIRGGGSPAWPASAFPDRPSLEEAIERHPFLSLADQPGYLELKSGTWQVEGDLVLPDGFGLWATEPVTLAFERQTGLFSTGPLLLYGPEEGEIRLVPKDADWGGIIVAQAGSRGTSSLHNVEIRETTGVRRDGWFMSGGVTFYQSPVLLNRCRVLGSTAQSAVHVVRSDFSFVRSEFGHTSYDAFDGDHVQGRIEQCAFHDVLGNGMDVRDSDVAVQNVSLLRIYDKGLLADTGSRVLVYGVHADDVGMAIASKDASYVGARDVRIARAWTAGIGAYLESAREGKSTVQASNILFQDSSPRVLAQKKSGVTIDGAAADVRRLEASAFTRRVETTQTIRVLNYRFGPAIRWIGYHLDTEEGAPGGSLRLVLYWQAFAELDQDYTIYVHVIADSGQIAAQWDTGPRGNTFPTTDWPMGEVIDDIHEVPLPPDMPAGEYQIVLGMYEWQSGARLPIYGRDGEELVNATAVLEQRVRIR
jgi:hypothetical protein